MNIDEVCNIIKNNLVIDKNLWDLYKDNFSYISHKLENYGRVCPICGGLYKTRFTMHLNNHGLTVEQYVFLRNNITKFPKCMNPECSNLVTYNTRNYELRKFCSFECRLYYNNHKPDSIWRYWTPEETGRTQEECDNHNKNMYCNRPDSSWRYWTPESTGKSKEECDEHNNILYERQSKLGRESTNLIKLNYSLGYRIKITTKNKFYILRSFPEFIYLLKLVYIDNIDINSINYEVEFSSEDLGIRRTDFLVNNTNYEIHPDGYESDKESFFKYLKSININSIYIPVSECWNYYELIKQFEPDLDNIYYKCKELYKSGEIYEYNKFKDDNLKLTNSSTTIEKLD